MIREAIIKVLESGESPGKLEIVKTPVKKAEEFSINVFADNDRDFKKEIDNFDENYKKCQKLADKGYTKRKDMPVINIDDVKLFQERLKKGAININTPHPSDDLKLSKNPFPEGLKGKQAQKWLEDGLKIHDGEDKDDKVKVTKQNISVGNLYPIQEQIYFDKSMTAIAQFGAEGTKQFLTTKSILIASSDNKIIDGHHRWLSANIIDPNMKVPCVVIDLPISKLLPLSLAYGDAIGNKRNR